MGIGKDVKLLSGVGLVLLGCSSGAFAQSSVYISGFLGSGIGYTSNVGGHSVVSETNGVLRPNSFSLQGKEDLGGGLQALFYLGSLFSMSTGTVLGAPGSLDRKSVV